MLEVEDEAELFFEDKYAPLEFQDNRRH